MAHVVDTTYGRNRDLGQVTDPQLLAYYASLGYTIDGTSSGVSAGAPSKVVAGVVPPYGSANGEVLTVQGGTVITAAPTGGSGGGSGVDQTARDAAAAVDARVTSLIAAAPAALDTLKELADALGDDANYAATITAALAGKAPLLDTLAVASSTAALTASKIQPFDATSANIATTALPALSGVTLGATYAVQKTDTSTHTVTVPFTGADTTQDGATSIVLSYPGIAYVQAVTKTGGGKWWKVVNHVRSDGTLTALLGNYATATALGNEVTRAQAAEAASATKAQALGYALVFGGI